MRPQRFGSVTLQKVAELPSLALDPNWLIGNATAEGVEQERSWLGPEFIEPASGRLLISVHSFLVRTPRLTVLVDTCCGNGRDRGPESPFDDCPPATSTSWSGLALRLRKSTSSSAPISMSIMSVGTCSNVVAASRQLFPTRATYSIGRTSSTGLIMTAAS